VQEALNNLGASLVLGSVLVVVVLALFLFDWRSALISVITIPMSLIAAGPRPLRPRQPPSTRWCWPAS
jgi:Cu/Ag efflux pump CusA